MSTLSGILPPEFGSFELFSLLPKELRLDIVEFALVKQVGQIITITSTFEEVSIPENPDNPYASYGSYNIMVEKYRAIYNIPSVLQVSREFRGVGLKHYHCLGEHFIYPLYFNPALDTLFFDGSYTLNILKYFKWSEKSMQTIKKVRSVSVGGKIMSWLANCLHQSSCPLTLFESLENLTLQDDKDAPTSRSSVAEWVKGCWTEMYRLAAEERVKSASLQTSFKDLREGLAVPDHTSHDVLIPDAVPDIPDQEYVSHFPEVYFKSKFEMGELGMRSLWVEIIKVEIESSNIMEHAQSSSTVYPGSRTSTPSILGPARPRPDRALAGGYLPATASSTPRTIPNHPNEIDPRMGGSTSSTPSIFGGARFDGSRGPLRKSLGSLRFNPIGLDQPNEQNASRCSSSASPPALYSNPSRMSRNKWSVAGPSNRNPFGFLRETANNELDDVLSPLSSILGPETPSHQPPMRDFTATGRSHAAHFSSQGNTSPVAYRTSSVPVHDYQISVGCAARPSALSVLLAKDRTYAIRTNITPSSPSRILRRPLPYSSNAHLPPPSSIATRGIPRYNLDASEMARRICQSRSPDNMASTYASRPSGICCGTKSPFRSPPFYNGHLTSHRAVYEGIVRDLPNMANNHHFTHTAVATASDASRDLSQTCSQAYPGSSSQITASNYNSPHTRTAALGSSQGFSQPSLIGGHAWNAFPWQH